MTRKVNAAALLHIKKSEGLRLNAYPDPGSIDGNPWTVGYGSTTSVHKGMTITEAEAEARLVDDLTSAENTVAKLVTVPLNDNQYGALVSFTFNIGRTAFAKSTLLRKLNAGDYAGVPAQLARWNKNDGKEMAGLTARRANEADLWAKPAAPSTPEKPAPAPTTAKQAKGPLAMLAAAAIALAIGLYQFAKANGVPLP